MRRMQLRLYITTLAVLMMPFVGHAQKWRVIEKKYSTHVGSGNYTTIDSIRYSYNAGSDRGSNYTNDTINYDSFVDIGDYSGTKLYDNNGNLLVNHVQKWNNNNMWEDHRSDSFTYQGNNLITHEVYTNTYLAGSFQLLITEKHQYQYDAQNRVSQKRTNYYNYGAVLPDTFYNYYAYNAQGQLVKDSVCKVSNSGATTLYDWHYFAYNTNDDTLYWERYTIDTSGKAILFSRVDYTYNAQGQLITDSLYYGPSNTLKHVKHSYAYDSQGRLLADTTKEYGHMARNKVTTYTYTSFNYYSEVNIGMLDSNGKIEFYHRINYKYEPYFPVSVKGVTPTDVYFTLYPNPATNMLFIATNEPYQQGRIYNSMGQMVQVVDANSKQVDISALPSGNYYLQLTTKEKTLSKSFTIVR